MKFAWAKLKYIHFKDILDFFIILLSFIPGMILKLCRPNIWLISERENDAHDNGYWLFKYIRENHPELPAYYSISFHCPDYEHCIKPLGHAIRHGSFKHHMYFWAASKYVSAHVGNGFPASFMCRLFLMQGAYFFQVIFLQHGVIMNKSGFLLGELNKIDYFVSSTAEERQFIIDELHYKPEQVVCLGLCRYDNLSTYTVIKNRVLIMPTWRWWLQPEHGQSEQDIIQNIRESNYYQSYKALFSDPRLLAFAAEHQLELVYFPHNQMQPFLDEFKTVCPQITCVSADEYNVQQALKDSAFLITDYSSVSIDFAYMKKPLAYFQFDKDEFHERHYGEGYFVYERDGFGTVAETVDGIVDALIASFQTGFQMQPEYQARVDRFFAYRDQENTKRNFDFISHL